MLHFSNAVIWFIDLKLETDPQIEKIVMIEQRPCANIIQHQNKLLQRWKVQQSITYIMTAQQEI